MRNTLKSIFFILFSFIGFSQMLLAQLQTQFTSEKTPISSSIFDEFSPAYFKDGIIYCSNKKNNVFVTYTDTSEDAHELFDMYFVKPNKDIKKWKSPEIQNNGLNTLFNDGPASFYSNFSRVVFNRNTYSEKKFGNYMKSGNTLGIFFATYSKSEWSDIQEFPYNSDQYNVLHPSITEDGKTLYFASDMPGGLGGFDLYVSNLKNGQWSKPENLGPKINTDRNEAFPFIHNSGRLYFASKGWNSRGGYDLFFTQQLGGKWIQVQNMKEPFNSTADDFGLIIDDYLQSGYFSSSRNKSDDIFAFKSSISEFESCKQQRKNNFCYVFFEEGTSMNDINSSMKYEWDLGDGTKVRALEAEHCYEKVGKYLVQLNVVDSMTGELLMNQAQYDFVVEEIEQPFITAPDFAVIGDTIKLDASKSNLKNFKVARYYWDFGDGVKAIGEKATHTFFEEGVYDVKLQLESTAGRQGVRKECVYRSVSIMPLQPK